MLKKERNSNFELMRIISILLIILCHIINFGGLYNSCPNQALRIIFEIVMFMTLVHVNSFVMLSGYYQSKSKFRFSKLLKIIIQVIFYSSVIYFIAVKIGWIDSYNIVTIISNFLPSIVSNYWFINVYIITYIFSDYINVFINKLSQKEFKTFLIVSFVVLSFLPYITGLKFLDNTGYNFFNFIFIYMIGAYLRKYPLKDSYHFKYSSTNGYRLLLFLIFCAMFFLNYITNNFANQIVGMSNIFSEISTRVLNTKFTYSTPFVIIQTISYFELFNTVKLKSKIVNILSTSVIGVYLFHENPIMREHLYLLLHVTYKTITGYSDIIWVVICILWIFIMGTIVEWSRIIFEKVLLKIPCVNKIIISIKKYLDSFNYHINW